MDNCSVTFRRHRTIFSMSQILALLPARRRGSHVPVISVLVRLMKIAGNKNRAAAVFIRQQFRRGSSRQMKIRIASGDGSLSRQIRDVFSGRPVIVSGRYTTPAKGTIRLLGRRADGPYTREIPVRVSAGTEVEQQLRNLGFESQASPRPNQFAGRIAIEKLAELPAVQYVAPASTTSTGGK